MKNLLPSSPPFRERAVGSQCSGRPSAVSIMADSGGGVAAPHDFLSNSILPSDVTGYSTSGVAGIFSTTGVDSVRPKVMA